ncbi:MAG: glycosyltransferase [Acidobacteriota bacterium]
MPGDVRGGQRGPSGVSPVVRSTERRVVLPQTNSTWDWLAGTYWYVPAENLLAYLSRPSSQQVDPIDDQTVFYISDCRNGYFWCQTAVQLGDQERTCYFLFGSVSPLGNVLLTFTSSANSSAQATVTHGSGVMCLFNGEAAMLNQRTRLLTQRDHNVPPSEPVSYVLLAHNEASTIEQELRAIDAAVIRRLPGSELIVAEDGSSDGTRGVIEGLREELCLRLVVSNERKGSMKAIVKGGSLPC